MVIRRSNNADHTIDVTHLPTKDIYFPEDILIREMTI